jgi:hypothetical protein
MQIGSSDGCQTVIERGLASLYMGNVQQASVPH